MAGAQTVRKAASLIGGYYTSDSKPAEPHRVGTDAYPDVSKQAVRFCESKGARNLVFDMRDYSEFGELFAPFALFVPTEWWVMEMAAQKNHGVATLRWTLEHWARDAHEEVFPCPAPSQATA